MNLVGLALLAALLLLVGMLFVMALIEASLLHVRRSAVATRADAGDRRARRLLGLLDDLPRVMNAVLLAVLLCQVSATTLSGVSSTIADHVRDTFSVPGSLTAIDVLRRMQSTGNHLAVVIGDEPAEPVGILTIEDIVEELVGTIAEPETR